MKNLNWHVRTVHEKATSFPCAECNYSTSRHNDLQKHIRKRRNHTPSVHNILPKIARREPIPNIIEPTENDQLLRDIEQQELTDMLNTKAGLGLSQMASTTPSSSLPPVNNIDPRQQEFERFFQAEQPWEALYYEMCILEISI